MIKGFFIKIFNNNVIYFIILYLQILSFNKKLFNIFKRPQILIEKKYNNQNILLLVLFEKSVLRPDIINLLQIAKKLNLFVIAVNTLRLSDVRPYSKLLDVYIERYNFGRDFGSYQVGFQYLFKKKYTSTCPRLLMCNDSVFYSNTNLLSFLKDHFNPQAEEVLGATENHEIEHHLGSFCISMSQKILSHKKFIKYWKRYSKTELRPTVIKKGEMKLSKVLKKCVSHPLQFRAIFDVNYLQDFIKKDNNFFINLPNLYRQSDLVEWPRSSLKAVYQRVVNKYFIQTNQTNNVDIKIDNIKKYDQFSFAHDFHSLSRFLYDLSKKLNLDIKEINKKVLEEARFDLIDCFFSGSHIHQNALLFYYMGLPIIKLDILYRGMFSNQDVLYLQKLVKEEEKNAMARLIFSKPFGGNVLFGWKRFAFYRGLL